MVMEISIIQLKHLSEICMLVGMIMLIVSGIIFVKLDVFKAWHFITGRRLKDTANKKSKSSNKKVENKELDSKMGNQVNTYTVRSNVEGISNATISLEDTVKLQPQDMPDYIQTETMLLEPDKQGFNIVCEITYIHANGI